MVITTKGKKAKQGVCDAKDDMEGCARSAPLLNCGDEEDNLFLTVQRVLVAVVMLLDLPGQQRVRCREDTDHRRSIDDVWARVRQ